jgi:ribosomal protein S18 acetylase RimI-like enzyme
MKVIKYRKCYADGVKNLLYELQEHLVNLDEYKIQIMLDKYKDEYLSDMIRKVKKRKGIIYVAVEDSNVLGFIAGTVIPENNIDRLTEDTSIKGRVDELCVENNIRSRGIGAALIKKMEEYLTSVGCKYIYIDVFGPNTRAQNFYYRNGYSLRNVEFIKKVNN